GGAAAGLDDVLRARLARLPDEARRLLEVVAVAGRPIAPPLLRRAAGLAADERGALATLRAGNLVRARTSPGQDEVEPFHDRIREIVVANLPPERLREHHLRLATTLAASGRADA